MGINRGIRSASVELTDIELVRFSLDSDYTGPECPWQTETCYFNQWALGLASDEVQAPVGQALLAEHDAELAAGDAAPDRPALIWSRTVTSMAVSAPPE